jgi:hypothetical protein
MRYEELPIERIELDKENPRIKQYLSIFTGEITSENISMALNGGGDHSSNGKYAALKESIKKNGGIFTPIIVNHISSEERYIVIEGNTRLKFYQEFYKKENDTKWSKIMAIVYDDMTNNQIHAIRLQAHMVGARDWDAFSKAKYLDYLYNTEKKSMEYLKVFCGGQECTIRNLISGYKDMVEFYINPLEREGEQLDPQVFSYFVEAQKSSCKDSLIVHDYDMNDFTKWVLTEKIERAEHVRKIAKILGEKDAREAFEKGTTGDAIKKLDSKEIDQKKLEKTDLYKIIHEITIRLRNIKHSEVVNLKNNPKYDDRKNELIDLNYVLQDVLNDIGANE